MVLKFYKTTLVEGRYTTFVVSYLEKSFEKLLTTFKISIFVMSSSSGDFLETSWCTTTVVETGAEGSS